MVTFYTGDLSLGQTSGTVSALNDFSVANSLYIDGTALTNNEGTLEWDGEALGGSSTFTGGTVADATTFSSDVTVGGTLAAGSITDVESEINTNTSSISTNTSAITANDTDIAANASSISTIHCNTCSTIQT